MEIKKVAQSDDFTAIARIYALSWKSAYKNIIPQQYLDDLSEKHWSTVLSSSLCDSFVIIDNGEYVGTSSICAARDESMNGWGEIISVYLLPNYFGKGFGKLLLDNSLSHLFNMGYNNVYLWVLEEHARARKFYEKNGFGLTLDKMPINIGNKDLLEVRYIYPAL